MGSTGNSKIRPLSEAYAQLGAKLAEVRESAGVTTREVPKGDGNFFTSGHISNVEKGRTAPSEELIRAYVGFGGDFDTLMTLLDKAKKPAPAPMVSVALDSVDEQLLDPRTNPYTLRRGYAVVAQDDITRINGKGVVERNMYAATVRQVMPNSRFFLFRYGYEHDPRPGVAHIEPGSGCSIAHMEEDDNGTIYAVLEFDPATTDEHGLCRLSWTIRVQSSVPIASFDAIHARARMGRVFKRVEFTEPAVPDKVWWFRGADPFINRLNPAENQLLELNPAHFYFHEFTNVENEACGLAWRWPVSRKKP